MDQSLSVLAAQTLVAQLRAGGVRDFVISPGSRSAPLAYALMANDMLADGLLDDGIGFSPAEVRVHVRLDERGEAFFALGLAKASGRPVAVMCTSGTAVANWHPAVLEADLARVPLVLVTADRPARLRGKLASQTIDQVDFFGLAVRWSADIPAGVAGNLVEYLSDVAQSAANAIQIATNVDYPGPVQLNIQFDDPLYPTVPLDINFAALGSGVNSEISSTDKQNKRHPHLTKYVNSASDFADIRTRAEIGEKPKYDDPYSPGNPANTIVIAGDGAGVAARRLAEAQGWPLVAEPTSGALGSPNAVIGSRFVVPFIADSMEHAIVFGRPTLSRHITGLLARKDIAVTAVAPGIGPYPDAWRNTAKVVRALAPQWYQTRRNGIEQLNTPVADAIAAVLSEKTDYRLVSGALVQAEFGPLILARLIAEAHCANPNNTLMVGASNPIRDLDLVIELEVGRCTSTGSVRRGGRTHSAAAPEAQIKQPLNVGAIYANRGVAGIDGTIATALGIATNVLGKQGAGHPWPAPQMRREPGTQLGTSDKIKSASQSEPAANRLYLGDLAFWHDANSLLLAKGEQRPQLQIIVANDSGGSIFETLEHGTWASASPAQTQHFEKYFATEQQADIGLLCAAHGIPHRLISDVSALRAALALPIRGVEVIEVRLNRRNRRSGMANLQDAVAQAVDAAATGSTN